VFNDRKQMFGVDRFGTLLFFLLFAFLIPGVSQAGWPSVVGSAANVASLIAGFSATEMGSNRRRLGVLVTIGVVSGVLVAFDQESIPATIGAFGQAVVLGAILLAVVRRVLAHERVGLPTINGAIAAYVLIGLFFAWIYLAMAGVIDGPVLDPDVAGLPSYYSFVVLTTLGFGDISPVNDLVQRLTALEAMVGQIFLATLVARLVSMYGVPARKK
jgi:hypothetical protein